MYLRFEAHLHPETPLLSLTALPVYCIECAGHADSSYKDGFALHLGLSSHPSVGLYYIGGASGFSVCTL